MQAPKQKQPDRPALFLLAPVTDDSKTQSHKAAHVRIRLRRWEARRAWSGRLLIALSFPLAYLLSMFASGQHAPSTAARIVIWLWVGALTAATICGEAIWRNRMRLELIVGEEPAASDKTKSTHKRKG